MRRRGLTFRHLHGVSSVFSTSLRPVAQDFMQSYLEEVLPYEAFSVRLPQCDIPRLHDILNSIPPQEVARLQVLHENPAPEWCSGSPPQDAAGGSDSWLGFHAPMSAKAPANAGIGVTTKPCFPLNPSWSFQLPRRSDT